MKSYNYHPDTTEHPYGYLALKSSVEKPFKENYYSDNRNNSSAYFDGIKFSVDLSKYETDQEAIRKSILPVSEEWYNIYKTEILTNFNLLLTFIESKDFTIKEGKACPVEEKKVCRTHISPVLENFFGKK